MAIGKTTLLNGIVSVWMCFSISCGMKERLHKKHLGSIDDSGKLSVEFIVPNSEYVFLVVGYPSDQLVSVTGTLLLSDNGLQKKFAIDDSLQEANWLKNEKLKSIIINEKSLVDYLFDGQSSLRLERGGKYTVTVNLTDFNKGLELYCVSLEIF